MSAFFGLTTVQQAVLFARNIQGDDNARNNCKRVQKNSQRKS